MASWLNLEGKTAVVTGGASGIGKAVAQAFLDNGANVVVCDMNPQTPEFDLHEGSGEMLYVVTNVTSSENITDMLQKAKEKFGKLDILVNNAGITRDNLILRMKPEEFQEVLDVNLTGTFHCMKIASRFMLKQRYGRIVSLSSVVGIYGNAGQVNYAASKAGIIGFSKSLAKEVASRGITVNCIAPGMIETKMTEVLTDKAKEAILSRIPMGRMGQPREVAEAALFLASRTAGYITAAVIPVDGGM